MEHQSYEDGIKQILQMDDVKFGLKNALFGVGCSFKNHADYNKCIDVTTEILKKNNIPHKDIEEYIASLQYGFNLTHNV
jgi:hypothetical protein